MSDLPNAVRESTLQIGGMTMRVYHLDDGRRVIHGDDVAAFFSGMGDTPTHEELTALAKIIASPSTPGTENAS